MGIAGNIGRVLQGTAAEPPPEGGDVFDPGEHTVAEVQTYLQGQPDPGVWAAVRAAEASGKNRVTLLAWIDVEGA